MPITIENRAVLGSVVAVAGIVMLPLLFHFWKLRNIKVIQSRNPILVIGHMVAHFLWIFGILMINSVKINCVGVYSFVYLTLTLTMTMLFLRMIHTWQEYELECKKEQYFSKRPNCPIKCRLERFKLRKSAENNYTRSLLFSAAPVVLVAIMLVSVHFTKAQHLDSQDQCDVVFMPASITAIVEVAILTLLSVNFLLKLRSIQQDTLGIVKEYSVWLVANVLIMAYGTIYVLYGQKLSTSGMDIASLLLVQLPMFPLLYFSLYLPIRRAQKLQRKMNESSTNSQRSSEAISSPKHVSFKQLTAELSAVLSSTESESFSNFLKAEFSVENFLFWKDVENFKNGIRLNDNQTLKEQAIFLRDQFISNDSPLSVNISAKNRSELIDRIEKGDISVDMFDAAQQEIFLLMVKDSYMRYRSKKHSFSAPAGAATEVESPAAAVESALPKKEDV